MAELNNVATNAYVTFTLLLFEDRNRILTQVLLPFVAQSYVRAIMTLLLINYTSYPIFNTNIHQFLANICILDQKTT